MHAVIRYATILSTLLLLLPLRVPADWDLSDPSKWVQLPDETIDGMDVKLFDWQGMPPLVLADDFLCRKTGPITDIHIWGSWKNDEVPQPELVTFELSIWSDIPTNEVISYSRPGDLLWQTNVVFPNYTVREWLNLVDGEWWYDPLEEIADPFADKKIWQYNFVFDPETAFEQQGSPEQPIVYWLGVRATVLDDNAPYAIGWKSSRTNWNDDAVYASDPGQWLELRYPVGTEPPHPRAGDSMDLAFVITTLEAPSDFGDAPEGAVAYPSLGISGQFPTCIGVGPAAWIQHGLGWAHFGPSWDAEPDGNAGICPVFSPGQYDQDECYNDGDAGLLFPESFTIVGGLGSEVVQACPSWTGTSLGTVCQPAVWGGNLDIVTVNNMPVQGYVNVLMDWNQDGQWGGSSTCSSGSSVPEHVLVNFPVPTPYSAPLSNLLPPNFQIGPNPGYVWTRFTVTERPVTLPWTGDGSFEDGETEDYLLRVDPEQDFGDAPDSVQTPGYPTLLANNGARHVLNPSVFMGALIDIESDGQPNVSATGDDINNLADEDGVSFTSTLNVNGVASVNVVCSVPGYLSAWIDYNTDRIWGPAEAIFTNQAMMAGANALSFTVPGGATVTNRTYARFRFTTSPVALSPAGPAPDGEVEDYAVAIEEELPEQDFGDAPDSVQIPGYPTLLVHNGARHFIVPGVYMGIQIDAEVDGQPTQNSDGDDLIGVDDEDGVTIPAPLTAGMATSVQVVASVPGYLNAWIDWNANGSWGDSGEQVYINQTLNPGPNILPLTVPPPPFLVAGGPHSRWRFTTYPVALPSYTGSEQDGEVEDYEVRLEILDFGDAPDPSYPTLLANSGAAHRIPSAYWLGLTAPDFEPDGQPDPNALGDDVTGGDEDGVTLGGPLVRGTPTIVGVIASTNGFLNAWLDFNANGSWLDGGEQIATNLLLTAGLNGFSVTPPHGAALGPTFARFRFSSLTGLTPSGFAQNGEVEDHAMEILQARPTSLVITNIVQVGGSNLVYWTSETNLDYQLQSCIDLIPTGFQVWTNIGGLVTGPADVQLDPAPAETTKFYRVTVPWTP